jgi:hypothetical protein
MFWKKEEERQVRCMFELQRDIVRVENKLNLILKEIGKEYVPEKDTTEPAKLVDKTLDWSQLITSCGGGNWTTVSAGVQPKKKRGRPKKK